MSIVSPKLDFSRVSKGMTRHAIAVQYDAGDPVYAMFAQAPQMPSFSLTSKSIARPTAGDVKGFEPGFVPLLSEQFGALKPNIVDCEPSAPLKVPSNAPRTAEDIMDLYEDVSIEFEKPIYYNDGLRPSVRPLTLTPVDEPAAPAYRPVGGGRKFPVKQMEWASVNDYQLASQMREGL